MNEIAAEKQTIRAEMRARPKLDPARRAELSQAASARLIQQPVFQHAQRLLAYFARSDELDLTLVLEFAWAHGKTVAVPRFDPAAGLYRAAVADPGRAGHAPGNFGILEPPPHAPVLPLNRLDLVLAPGLAFDPGGRRLGRGKGFYDRLLAEVTGAKCGIALDEQILPRVPAEPHDVVMNFILTPSRWLAAPSPEY